MARGKYAARAERRADSAKDEHIHRLTDWLAEAKLRARQCERDAAKVPELNRRIAELEAEKENDTVLKEILDTARAWVEHGRLAQQKAESYRTAFLEIAKEWTKLHPMGGSTDWIEYVSRRWPHCFREGEDIHVFRDDIPKKLSDEAVKRIQRARGERYPEFNGMDLADWLIKRTEHDEVHAS